MKFSEALKMQDLKMQGEMTEGGENAGSRRKVANVWS